MGLMQVRRHPRASVVQALIVATVSAVIVAGCSSAPIGSDAQERPGDARVDAVPLPVDAVPIVIDTILDTRPPSLTNVPHFDFHFHATIPQSTFSCIYDQRDPIPCSSPTPIDSADGSHFFSVAATSPTGDVDTTPATYSWTVDTTPPNTILLVGPPALDMSATAHFEFTSNDPTAGFLCQLDNGPLATCTSPWDQPVVDADHTEIIQAIDPAGNVDPTPLMIMWTTDTQGGGSGSGT